jgi:Trypsin-co-occurring domain 1
LTAIHFLATINKSLNLLTLEIMTKLVPIQLDDNTVIYIETTEDAIAPFLDSPHRPATEEEAEEAPVTRGLPSVQETQRQAMQNIQAIESTIRAYTTYTLSAFRNLTVANIDKVTLKFGIEIGGEAGIPYVTKGTAKSNLNIEVECSFPRQSSK